MLSGVQDLVERWCQRTPDRCAVRDPATGQELSYAELWRRSGRLAGDLTNSSSVEPGHVVAIGLGRSIELVIAMLGIVRAGAVYLPLDNHAPADRQAGMLLDSGVRTIVLRDNGLPSANVHKVVVPQDIPVGGEPSLPVGPGGDDPIYIMYTSGSTGQPKGVVVPHRAVIRLVVEPNYCTVEPADRVAHSSNPAFDASTFEIWGALAAGATVVVFPAITEVGVENWEALVRRERITAMFLTTALFHSVARERPATFASLRTLMVGGEQLEQAAVRQILTAGPPGRLVNIYGPTEATTFSSYFDCTEDSIAGRDRIPVGYPLQNTSLHVLDELLRPVPTGTTGELCIGGPGVALGYQNRPELTARRFVVDPRHGVLYRTGDLARQHPDGAVDLLGRRDRQVKLRGFRIELEEIERAATATGLVDAAFAEKVGDGPSAVLIGFALPAAGTQTVADLGGELSRRLARTLPGYMIPTRWLVLEHLPLGPTGKVDRAALVALLDQPVEALDALAEWIRAVCREMLGLRSVRDRDNLLDLGGNSITAMQLAARIGAEFGIDLEPAEILLSGSLFELAARLHVVLADNAGSAAR